jgi:putative ABC transport system permease protein
MRLADILRLALSALWQQKARTLLTMVGVIFGSFVLAASLSIDQGVQETIERESRRSTELRKVQVQPQYEGRESDIPRQELKVTGELNDARRERIRKALVNRKLTFNLRGPRSKLDQKRLRDLRGLPHVEAVVPFIRLNGWAGFFGKPPIRASTISVPPDDDSLRQRLVAGRFLDRPNERSALVTELLLYQAGITDDAAIDGIVGQKVRLEFHAEQFGAGLGLYLTKPDSAGTTRPEQSSLDKIKDQLPGRLDKFDLTPVEKDALQKALRAAPPRAAKDYATELTIAGVLRMPTATDRQVSWEVMQADILLPLRTAEDLFFQAQIHAESGVDRATLVIDREENVKEVLAQVRNLELNAWAAVEFIDKQRLMYLLIFGAMTCVAGVALLVAALGIANTMLMSVLERTREVGIMKAVGAASREVQLIFLVEGALIGLVGGSVGLFLGWAASFPGDHWVRSMVQRDMQVELKESLFVFPPWLILAVMSFTVLVTTLAAVYPARRAAKVNPVTALRHE